MGEAGLPMVDVFISYSRSDKAVVAVLARAVEAAGYRVWWDAELPPHQSYGDVITDKIATAKAAIVVWSASAVKSEWVRAEADMARNQRKLIQTALDNVTPPLPFNQIQYAEMGDWQGEDDHPGWRKVKLSLADLCGQPGTSQPSVASAPPPPPPPPRPHPQPVSAAPSASRWPLFAGIGIAVAALAVAGYVLLGRGAPTPVPAVAPGPIVAAPASAAPPAPVAAAPAPAPVAAAAAPEPVRAGAEDQGAVEPNPSDMTFADSSTRLLTSAEVAALGPTTLRVARNEIYARKGRRFKDAWLRDWFGRYAWYRPRFDEVPLNSVEQRNVDLLRQAEARYQ